MTNGCVMRAAALLATLATAALSSSLAGAQACGCTHQGGSVACPASLPPGSRSVEFVPGGTRWVTPQGQQVFVPQTTFPACTTTPAAPPAPPPKAPPVETPKAPPAQPPRPPPADTPSAPPLQPPSLPAPVDTPKAPPIETPKAPPVEPPPRTQERPRQAPPSPPPIDRARTSEDRARQLIDPQTPPIVAVPPAPEDGRTTDETIQRMGRQLRDERPTAPARQPTSRQDPSTSRPDQPTSSTTQAADCPLELDIHRPISQDDDEPIVPKAEQLSHGAYTLRNDDADRVIGRNLKKTGLPVADVATDLDPLAGANPNENDLVRVVARNPTGLPNVYLFAFALASENSTALGTPVSDRGKLVRQANDDELRTWSDAIKTAAAPAFRTVIGAEGRRFWTEGRLGGRYRLVIGVLPPDAKNPPASVKYDVATGTTKPALECMQQATLTVVVVDIFQGSPERLTAFDVFWGGLPHFRAEVWPGGGTYEWAADYKEGRAVRKVPGRARDGEAGFMTRDASDGEPASGAAVGGRTVTASGTAPAGNKARFEGGLEVHTPVDAGGILQVNRDPANRYPYRMSVAYTVDGERLVRAEPLEVILPQLRAIPAGQYVIGDNRSVESKVEYRIVDAFDRPIVAGPPEAYVRVYGAGLKAWEALGADPGHTVERRDDMEVTNLPAGARPFRLGTAQRSQAPVLADRMTGAAFKDTLRFQIPDAANTRMTYWQSWTGRTTQQDVAAARQEAAKRSEDYRRAADDATRDALKRADAARSRRYPVFAIRQDVILQLRAGDRHYDVSVLSPNTLTVYAPYFLDGFATAGSDASTRSYGLQFQPGTDVGPRLVGINHLRAP